MRRGAALLVALAFGVGCSRKDEAPPQPARLVVAFSGEDLGRVEPCGCTSAMLGGLARRPARLASLVEPGVPFAYVSGGRLVEGGDEYDRSRLGMVLRALARMNCAAYGPSTERGFELTKTRPIPRDAGVPVVLDEWVKLPTGDVAAYARGVVAWNGFDASKARASLPAGAALVLLTDADLATARELARDIDGPALVLYAAGRAEPRESDVAPGAVAFAPYPAKGEYVGVARLVGDGWTVEYRPVLHDLPEDPAIVALRASHLVELRGRETVRRSSSDPRWMVGGPPKHADDYVGNESCAQCHAGAAAAWTASKHAKAMATLAATGDDADPACVRCHVVGYGTGRGFDATPATKRLADVGCEACHGPRATHVEARRELRADAPRPAAGAASCAPCHDAEHDPDFDFAARWKAVEHGAK